MSRLESLRQNALSAWRKRPARERLLLGLGTAVLLAALVWTTLLAPAWRVWQQAPTQQARIEQQTREMLQLQAQARQLQAPRRVDRAEALRLLQDSAQALLGPGVQLAPQGDELRVTLKAASPTGLAQWLEQARDKALARPHMARLQQAAEPVPPRPGQSSGNPASPAASGPSWSGTLVLRLP